MWAAKPARAVSEPRISRMPELVLGVIGGVLGLLFIPVMVFLGGFMEAYTGNPTTLYAQAGVSALISIIGLVAAVLVKSNPRAWGICLVICGIVGVIVASGYYVGGLMLLVAGILALVRSDPKEGKDAMSFLTEERPRTPRKTLLAYGSYPLDESTVDARVTKVSPGAYAVGAEKGKHFSVQLVGRSDTDIRPALKQYIGEYDRFKFEYFDTPEAAFVRECLLYHRFNEPAGRLAEGHPVRSAGTSWQCPKCNAH